MNLRDKLRERGEGAPTPEDTLPATPPKSPRGPLLALDVNRRFMLIAGAAAALAAVVAVMYLNNSASGLSAGGTKLDVVVLNQDVQPGTKLTEDVLTTKEIPQAYLPKGYYTSIAKIKDRIAIAPMVEGEPVIQARISYPDAKYGIAYLLKPGERAKTISVNSAEGLAGLIRPGNEVDLYATIPDPNDSNRRIGTPVLQKALVIAVGNELMGEVPKLADTINNTDNSGISAQGTITLAMPLEKVRLVSLLEDLGNLKMVLRAPDDNSVTKPQFSDDTIMALVSGYVPKPAATPAPAVHHAPPQVIVRTVETSHPVYVIQHEAPPKPHPKPQPKPHNVEVIQFHH